jgi:hypothetical protein
MSKAIGAWKGEGVAFGWVASQVALNSRQHRTLWIGVLYATTIVVVLAVVARIY